MLRIHKADQEVIREKIREGRIEGAALGRENVVDIIIKKMKGWAGIPYAKANLLTGWWEWRYKREILI
jgi:hypothetical protein